MSDKGRSAIGTRMLFISFNRVHSGLSLAPAQHYQPQPYLMYKTPFFIHVPVDGTKSEFNDVKKVAPIADLQQFSSNKDIKFTPP